MTKKNKATGQKIKTLQSHITPRRQRTKEKKYQGYQYCPKCYLVYYKKAWHEDEELARILKQIPSIKKVTCPVCQQLKNNICQGLLILKNADQIRNTNKVLDLIKNIVKRRNRRDILEQILVLSYNQNSIEICTSENQLCLAMAKQIKRAFKGELEIKWSHRDKGVRIYWYPPPALS